MRSVLLLPFIVLLTGCAGAGTSLREVRATEPLQSGSFAMPFAHLAVCVKARVKTDPWTFDSQSWARNGGLIDGSFVSMQLMPVPRSSK
jgi:hypothetical protein